MMTKVIIFSASSTHAAYGKFIKQNEDWSSIVYYFGARLLYFSSGFVNMTDFDRAEGFSIRCVAE